MPRIRILIAEDETMMRLLLERRLSAEPDFEVVGQAADGREAVDLAARHRPDVLVTDLEMPHLNGLQATQTILARQPQLRVVLLTAHEDLAQLGSLIGAAECLNKRASPDDLVAAVRRAWTAAPPSAAPAPAAAGFGAAIQHLALRHHLTERERTVIEQAVETEDTLQQIASGLTSQTGERVTVSAVKHALDRAMTKLDVEPRTRNALVKRVVAIQQELG